MKVVKKKFTWALKVFIILYFLARLFKIMHWPNPEALLLISAVVLIVFYPFRYLAKQEKVLLDHVKMALAFVYSINTLFHLKQFPAMVFLETGLFFYWFINEGFYYFDFNLKFNKVLEKEDNILDDFKETKLDNRLEVIIDWSLVISFCIIIISSFLKIMHWPLQNEIMIIGFSLFIISIWFKKI